MTINEISLGKNPLFKTINCSRRVFDGWPLLFFFSNFDGWRLNIKAFEGSRLYISENIVQEIN